MPSRSAMRMPDADAEEGKRQGPVLLSFVFVF
jgi:hypothetical protein